MSQPEIAPPQPQPQPRPQHPPLPEHQPEHEAGPHLPEAGDLPPNLEDVVVTGRLFKEHLRRFVAEPDGRGSGLAGLVAELDDVLFRLAGEIGRR